VTGEEAAQDVRFLKIYTVFNVAQIDGLPERFQPAPAPVEAPALPTPERITHADAFFAEPGPSYATAEGRPITRPRRTEFRCRPSMRSATPRAIMRPSGTKLSIGLAIRRGSIAALAAREVGR